MKVQKMRFNHRRLSVHFHTHAKKNNTACRSQATRLPALPPLAASSAPSARLAYWFRAGACRWPDSPAGAAACCAEASAGGKNPTAGRTTQWRPTGGTVGGRRPFVDRAVRDTLRPRPSLVRSLLTHQAAPPPPPLRAAAPPPASPCPCERHPAGCAACRPVQCTDGCGRRA